MFHYKWLFSLKIEINDKNGRCDGFKLFGKLSSTLRTSDIYLWLSHNLCLKSLSKHPSLGRGETSKSDWSTWSWSADVITHSWFNELQAWNCLLIIFWKGSFYFDSTGLLVYEVNVRFTAQCLVASVLILHWPDYVRCQCHLEILYTIKTGYRITCF